jgi:DNA-binding NarL/FixJ family response regulator
VTVRVLLADDQPLVRAGLRTLLESCDDIEVVGEAASGTEAVERACAERPDVVLMDIRMPGLDGLEATRWIVADERLPGVRVVVLTTFDLDEYVYQALRVGPAASWPRTWSRASCATPCGWSPAATRCCRRG